MMLNHLGQHPDLYAYPLETYILPFFLQAEPRYGDLQVDANFRKLWTDICGSYVFRARNSGQPLPLPDDWFITPRNTAAIFDSIMHSFAAREGKERWSEKTPMYVLHICRLATAFPESRFIHMIRDGRDCAASDHKRWGRHPVGTIFRWQNAVKEGRRQGREINDRYLELRYEEVTERPEESLRIACEFIGIPYDTRILSTDRPRPRVTGQCSKTIVGGRRHNLKHFSENHLYAMEGIAGQYLAELGYTVNHLEGNSVPFRMKKVWWFVHDLVRTAVRHVEMKRISQKRTTWLLVFRRWKMIIRSKMSHRHIKTR